MSDWAADEITRLRTLAAEGLSASQIAAQLPGRSRNAVIGKIERGKGQYGTLLGQPKNQAIGRATPKTGTAPKRKYKPIVAPPIVPSPVELLFTSPNCVSFSKPVEIVANLPATLPFTFLDAMMKNRCLHYAGDPFSVDGPDMPVCGAERSPHVLETRYCRRHLILERRVAA